jgi:hypothetical protein
MPIPNIIMDNPQLRVILNDPNRVHFVGMVTRPGVPRFVSHTEYDLFSPGTDREKEFGVFHMLVWGLPWSIVSVPKIREIEVTKMAESFGLRVRLAVPLMIESPELTKFTCYPWGSDNYGIMTKFLTEQHGGIVPTEVVLPRIDWFPLNNSEVRMVDTAKSYSDEETAKLLAVERDEVSNYVVENGIFAVTSLVNPKDGIQLRQLLQRAPPMFVMAAHQRGVIKVDEPQCGCRLDGDICGHVIVKLGKNMMVC